MIFNENVSIKESDDDNIYEYMPREDQQGWQHWRERVPIWTYPKHQERPKFAQLTIPTANSMRYEYLLGLAQASGKVRNSMPS